MDEDALLELLVEYSGNWEERQYREHILREIQKKQHLSQLVQEHKHHPGDQLILEASKRKTVLEIQKKFQLSNINSTYVFPLILDAAQMSEEDSFNNSLEVDFYNLQAQNVQNKKKQLPVNSEAGKVQGYPGIAAPGVQGSAKVEGYQQLNNGMIDPNKNASFNQNNMLKKDGNSNNNASNPVTNENKQYKNGTTAMAAPQQDRITPLKNQNVQPQLLLSSQQKTIDPQSPPNNNNTNKLVLHNNVKASATSNNGNMDNIQQSLDAKRGERVNTYDQTNSSQYESNKYEQNNYIQNQQDSKKLLIPAPQQINTRNNNNNNNNTQSSNNSPIAKHPNGQTHTITGGNFYYLPQQQQQQQQSKSQQNQQLSQESISHQESRLTSQSSNAKSIINNNNNNRASSNSKEASKHTTSNLEFILLRQQQQSKQSQQNTSQGAYLQQNQQQQQQQPLMLSLNNAQQILNTLDSQSQDDTDTRTGQSQSRGSYQITQPEISQSNKRFQQQIQSQEQQQQYSSQQSQLNAASPSHQFSNNKQRKLIHPTNHLNNIVNPSTITNTTSSTTHQASNNNNNPNQLVGPSPGTSLSQQHISISSGTNQFFLQNGSAESISVQSLDQQQQQQQQQQFHPSSHPAGYLLDNGLQLPYQQQQQMQMYSDHSNNKIKPQQLITNGSSLFNEDVQSVKSNGVDSQRKSVRNKNSGPTANQLESQYMQQGKYQTESTPDNFLVQQQAAAAGLAQATHSQYKNKWIDFKKYPKEPERRVGGAGAGAAGIVNSSQVDDAMQTSASNIRNTYNSMSPQAHGINPANTSNSKKQAVGINNNNINSYITLSAAGGNSIINNNYTNSQQQLQQGHGFLYSNNADTSPSMSQANKIRGQIVSSIQPTGTGKNQYQQQQQQMIQFNQQPQQQISMQQQQQQLMLQSLSPSMNMAKQQQLELASYQVKSAKAAGNTITTGDNQQFTPNVKQMHQQSFGINQPSQQQSHLTEQQQQLLAINNPSLIDDPLLLASKNNLQQQQQRKSISKVSSCKSFEFREKFAKNPNTQQSKVINGNNVIINLSNVNSSSSSNNININMNVSTGGAIHHHPHQTYIHNLNNTSNSINGNINNLNSTAKQLNILTSSHNTTINNNNNSTSHFIPTPSSNSGATNNANQFASNTTGSSYLPISSSKNTYSAALYQKSQNNILSKQQQQQQQQQQSQQYSQQFQPGKTSTTGLSDSAHHNQLFSGANQYSLARNSSSSQTGMLNHSAIQQNSGTKLSKKIDMYKVFNATNSNSFSTQKDYQQQQGKQVKNLGLVLQKIIKNKTLKINEKSNQLNQHIQANQHNSHLTNTSMQQGMMGQTSTSLVNINNSLSTSLQQQQQLPLFTQQSQSQFQQQQQQQQSNQGFAQQPQQQQQSQSLTKKTSTPGKKKMSGSGASGTNNRGTKSPQFASNLKAPLKNYY